MNESFDPSVQDLQEGQGSSAERYTRLAFYFAALLAAVILFIVLLVTGVWNFFIQNWFLLLIEGMLVAYVITHTPQAVRDARGTTVESFFSEDLPDEGNEGQVTTEQEPQGPQTPSHVLEVDRWWENSGRTIAENIRLNQGWPAILSQKELDSLFAHFGRPVIPPGHRVVTEEDYRFIANWPNRGSEGQWLIDFLSPLIQAYGPYAVLNALSELSPSDSKVPFQTQHAWEWWEREGQDLAKKIFLNQSSPAIIDEVELDALRVRASLPVLQPNQRAISAVAYDMLVENAAFLEVLVAAAKAEQQVVAQDTAEAAPTAQHVCDGSSDYHQAPGEGAFSDEWRSPRPDINGSEM